MMQAANDGVTMTFDPSLDETQAEFPASFTITFTGDNVVSIAKSVLNYNPIMVTTPDGKTMMQCPGAFSENVMTVTTNKNLDRTLTGAYTVTLLAGNTFFVDAEGNKTACEKQEFIYNVGSGSEVGGDDPIEEGVAYDIAFGGITTPKPSDGEINIAEKDFTTIQFQFNKGNLKAVEGATVKLVGPEYEEEVPMYFNMNHIFGTSTIFKATFTEPKYNGEYTLSFGRGVVGDDAYIADPTTGHSNEPVTYTFNIVGGKDAPAENAVKYDILLSAFNPRTSATDTTVDVSEKDFATIQLTFNMANLKAVEGKTVTLKGPGFNMSTPIKFSMNGWNGKSCVFMGSMNDPVYNGTYTLTIPEGTVGTDEYIEDPHTGHTNGLIEYVFELIGGKDVSEMTEDTSLSVKTNIALASTVTSLSDLTLIFDEPVFFNEDATMTVKVMKNLAAIAYSNFGTATAERISDTEVKVIFNPEPEATASIAEYRLIIPKGTFRTNEDAADPGVINAALNIGWYVMKDVVYVDVLSHQPRTDQYVDGFAEGEGIVISTDNDDAVSYMKLTVTEYELENDFDSGTKILNNVTSSEKTASGAICWINEGDYIICHEGYYYEVSFELYNEDDIMIGDGLFEFYGNNDGSVAVNAINAENGEASFFNLEGVKVSGNLPAGVYVKVNGNKTSKVIVK